MTDHAAKSHKTPSTLGAYVIGFISSLVLTITAFWLVTEHILSGGQLVAAIMCLAVYQLLIQLIFFLHLGREDKPRWNLLAFLFMFLVLFIIVAGSLWIMENLNYNMMLSPEQMDEYMKIQNDKGF